jgi:hypothetical protein
MSFMQGIMVHQAITGIECSDARNQSFELIDSVNQSFGKKQVTKALIDE